MDSKGRLEFKVNDEWLEFARQNPWISFVPEFATDGEQVYMKPKDRSVVFKAVSEDAEGNISYECNSCGSEIKAARVAHPIWDGPFPMSGSGRCEYEPVPYCPKCEKEPNFHGAPIR